MSIERNERGVDMMRIATMQKYERFSKWPRTRDVVERGSVMAPINR
jgi:hypothetical protein